MKTIPMATYSPAPPLPPRRPALFPSPPAQGKHVRSMATRLASCNLTQHGPMELARELALIERHPDAHRPFVSDGRTAYRRVLAEIARREAEQS